MKGWLVVAIGLGLAVAGAWVLLSGDAGSGDRGRAPYGEIRDESREAMRDLLRDAEGDRP